MQDQHFQPSWEYNSVMESSMDMDMFTSDYEFSSSFSTAEEPSDISSVFYSPRMTSNTLLPMFTNNLSIFPSQQYSPRSDDSSIISNDQPMSDAFGVDDWIQEMNGCSETNLPSHNFSFTEERYEGYLSPSQENISVQPLLVIPKDGMEIENQSSIPCLFKAYGEAIENDQEELANVISQRVREMVSPMGSTLERLAYYFFQDSDLQDNYLQQESSKNYAAAFRAFYQILPHGRFAHLTANMAILESIPFDVETIHIIDFDMGDGVQISSLFQAIGKGRAVRLTSIRWKEDCDSPLWNFQDTKRRLCNHAQNLGLKLEIEKMDMEDLVTKLRKNESIFKQKEWMIFNCMVSLPHMGRERSRRLVTEFLMVAKELIFCKGSNLTRGIITLGEGNSVEESKRNCSGFGEFLPEYLIHFHALFQSMEFHFPSQLAEARIMLENLFLAPYVSSMTCFRRWNEISLDCSGSKPVSKLSSLRFSQENFQQATEIAKEGSSMYSVKIEEVDQNAMSLEWSGTPLVRVSTWR